MSSELMPAPRHHGRLVPPSVILGRVWPQA